MGNFLQDARYGVRMLMKKPGFTVAAVISLALGIGGNTAIFSVVNAVLLRSLPYKEPSRLVMLWFTPPNRPDQNNGVSVANYLALKEQNRVFENIGALQFGWPVNLTNAQGESVAERVTGQKFSANLFQALGVQPLLGRFFLPAEDEVGADPVVLISHRFWQRRFGGDPAVAGKALRIDGQLTTVIGVMPAGFNFFNEEAEFWLPFRFASFNIQSRTRYLGVAARLKPGVDLKQAQTEMNAAAVSLAQAYPDTNKDWGIKLEPLQEAFIGWIRQPLLVLQGAVVFVLLIACANVASLLLAQASSRQKEIAIRSALGAGRLRVVRQFLTESVMLSVTGGALGLLLAYWGLRALVAMIPRYMPRLSEMSIDGRVLTFTVLLSVLTGLIFGVAPALEGSRCDLTESLKESGRGATAGLVRQRLRSVLVVTEIALALVLLVGAGLMINSFVRLQGNDPGCDPRNLLTFQVRLSRQEYVKDVGAVAGFHAISISPQVPEFFQRVFERLQSLPGVKSATASNYPPLGGWGLGGFNFVIEGRPRPTSEKEALSAGYNPIASNYFRTLGVPLLKGRDLTDHDTADAPWVVVINKTMARRYWPNEDPIGQRLTLDMGVKDEKPREVVGVAADIRHNQWEREGRPQMYVPHTQQPLVYQGRYAEPRLTMTFVLRTAGDPMSLASAVRSAVAEIDRRQPVFNIRTAEQHMAEQVQEPRIYMLLLGIFGGIAVALSAVGIYGLMAYSVTQRTHEIGIRMALGAGVRDVLKLVIRQGLALILIGVITGVAGALALTRLIENLLWGVKPTDPLTFAAVSLLLIAVALLACYIPGRRATKVDPMVALRYE